MMQKSVGKFVVSEEDELGSGGYGRVVVARDSSTGALVAAKVISTTETAQRQAVAHEVGLMKLLNHPNIIRLFGFEILEAGECYIFMELASQGELFGRVLQHGNLAEKEAKGYFYQLMSAVQFMHDNGVVHRDLKLVRVAVALERGAGCSRPLLSPAANPG